MNNIMKAKEEKLQGRHRDTHTALQWLRQNRELFAGNVYEPMMLVVSSAQTFGECLHFNPSQFKFKYYYNHYISGAA